MVDRRGTSGRRRLLRAGVCALAAAGTGVALGSIVPIERTRAEGEEVAGETAPGRTDAQPNPVQLGPGASLGGRRPFPDDNPWNQDVSQLPVDPNSDALIASIRLDRGLHADFGTVWNGAPNGIPYVVVGGDQPKVPVRWTAWGDESDPGPYPVPPDA